MNIKMYKSVFNFIGSTFIPEVSAYVTAIYVNSMSP